MSWHNVLFKLSTLISRLWSLFSEDEANTLHFLVRCWITLSQCLFAASREDSLSWLPLELLIIHKGHSGMKSKAEGRWVEWNNLKDKGAHEFNVVKSRNRKHRAAPILSPSLEIPKYMIMQIFLILSLIAGHILILAIGFMIWQISANAGWWSWWRLVALW